MFDDDETSPTLYERHFLDGQYANWKMSTKYSNVNPGTHLLISMAILIGTLAMMLLLAPLGLCFVYPYDVWDSACDFGRSILITSGKIELSKENCNTIYEIEDWQKKPTIIYPEAIQGHTYSVLFLDPDAEDHPNGTYFLHMLQVNVKGEDLKEGKLTNSLTILPYFGPKPSNTTGLHRFMFVIYEHCRPVDLLPYMSISSRIKFDLRKWFESIPITLLGPRVGVQFRSELFRYAN